MPVSSITDWILAVTSIVAAIAGISGMIFSNKSNSYAVA